MYISPILPICMYVVRMAIKFGVILSELHKKAYGRYIVHVYVISSCTNNQSTEQQW